MTNEEDREERKLEYANRINAYAQHTSDSWDMSYEIADIILALEERVKKLETLLEKE